MLKMVAFWRAASDLVQKVVHDNAADKPVTTVDAQKAFFYTGLVMYEVDTLVHQSQPGTIAETEVSGEVD
jgi:hypothetical protein